MDFKNTALVLVDLQKGIANTVETAPHSVSTVLNNAAKMVELFRKNEGFIAFIRVDFIDGKDALKPNAMKSLPGGSPNPDLAEIVDELGVKSTDYVVSKRGFSGFLAQT